MKKEIEIPEEFMTEELEAIAAESEDAENAKAFEAENTADGDKTVPLAALQRERERVRALKREAEEAGKIVKRLLEETGLGSVEALQARMDELSLQNFMQKRGVDSEVARMIQQQQEEIKNLKKLQKRGEKDMEIRALRENPLYSDIDEVLETVSEYADEKGLSVKEAYNAMFGEERAKKLRAAAREEALSEAKNRQGKKIPALSSVGNAPSEGKDGAKLSAEEIGWAQMAGLTPDEYAKYKH